MRILDSQAFSSLLSLREVIEAVEAAMIAYENQEAVVPQRMHIDKEKDTMLCMPAWGPRYIGTKLVSVFPGNKENSLPVTNGTMLLSDGKTGQPLALLNAAKLTALRTGALGAIGIKYLTPVGETSIGLIGCGTQGIHQAVFACEVRNISAVHYLHRSDASAERLKNFLHSYFPQVMVLPSHSAEELLSKTNIIVAATTSVNPVLPDDEKLLRGKHFISIGSYKPSMQELPDAVYRLAGKLFLDSEFARHEVGDYILPIQKKILRESEVFTLGKIIIGKQTVEVTQTTAYKSAGMALYDLFVAQAIFEKAEQLQAGTVVAL